MVFPAGGCLNVQKIECPLLLAMCLVMISLMIGLLVWIFVFGSSGVEWVDEQGKGNGYCHSIFDARGVCQMRFRLSNYSSVNGVYKLSIWGCSNSRDVEVVLVKYGASGDILHRDAWKKQLCDLNAGIELPSFYVPKNEMESLEIKVRYLEESDTKQKTKPLLSVLLRARKVFYFPCV